MNIRYETDCVGVTCFTPCPNGKTCKVASSTCLECKHFVIMNSEKCILTCNFGNKTKLEEIREKYPEFQFEKPESLTLEGFKKANFNHFYALSNSLGYTETGLCESEGPENMDKMLDLILEVIIDMCKEKNSK